MDDLHALNCGIFLSLWRAASLPTISVTDKKDMEHALMKLLDDGMQFNHQFINAPTILNMFLRFWNKKEIPGDAFDRPTLKAAIQTILDSFSIYETSYSKPKNCLSDQVYTSKGIQGAPGAATETLASIKDTLPIGYEDTSAQTVTDPDPATRVNYKEAGTQTDNELKILWVLGQARGQDNRFAVARHAEALLRNHPDDPEADNLAASLAANADKKTNKQERKRQNKIQNPDQFANSEQRAKRNRMG